MPAAMLFSRPEPVTSAAFERPSSSDAIPLPCLPSVPSFVHSKASRVLDCQESETMMADELAAAFCIDPSDHVPRRPAMTAFRQTTRLHQARWRDAHGHPIG